MVVERAFGHPHLGQGLGQTIGQTIGQASGVTVLPTKQRGSRGDQPVTGGGVILDGAKLSADPRQGKTGPIGPACGTGPISLVGGRDCGDAAGRRGRGGDNPAARLTFPPGAVRAAVVLHPATGAPAGFHRAFATWLAAKRDCAVLIHDYLGVGAPATGPLRQSRTTMIDWGLHDQAAAPAKLVPGVPRWVTGQSLGGLWLGFNPAMAGVKRVVTVGSGLTHVSDHPLGYGLKTRTCWQGPMQWLAAAISHLPGARLGLGAFCHWRLTATGGAGA